MDTTTTGKVRMARVSAAHARQGWPYVTRPSNATASIPLPTVAMKKPRPKSPNTMEGMPARFAMQARTRRARSERDDAYSVRYTAVATPAGMAAMVISNVSATVPTMAGKMPPAVIPWRGYAETNSQDRTWAPPRTTSTTTTASMRTMVTVANAVSDRSTGSEA